MKRRDFLGASAVFSLLAASPAFAAKKSDGKKPTAKSTGSTGKTTKSTKPTKASSAKGKPQAKPQTKPTTRESGSESELRAEPHTEPRNVLSLPDEPAQWRTYDVHSQITLKSLKGKARLWLPLTQYKDTLWERSLGYSWKGNFEDAGVYRDPVADMEVFYADWPEGTSNPQLQIVSKVATQKRTFDITRRVALAERTEVLRRALQPNDLIPIDGIVQRTAERAIGRFKDPLAQGKAIYEWVVENTLYDPLRKSVASRNIGDMLDSGDLSGRSGDIAQLFVALCRSIGIPARPVFGLRMDSSRLFGSLGTNGNLSTAQHCRAEFYSPGYGWVPVDPADVRKAIREEHLGNSDPKLTVLKKLLFGFWEMNWIAFNAAQDVNLRDSTGKTLPFLIYPVVETKDGRFDSLDTQRMSYNVTASRADY